MKANATVPWIDWSGHRMSLVLKKGSAGTLYLCVVGAKHNSDAVSALPYGGFHRNKQGLWIQKVADGQLGGTLARIHKATKPLLPLAKYDPAMPLERCMPDYAASLQPSNVRRISAESTRREVFADQPTQVPPASIGESDTQDDSEPRNPGTTEQPEAERPNPAVDAAGERPLHPQQALFGPDPQDLPVQLRTDDLSDVLRDAEGPDQPEPTTDETESAAAGFDGGDAAPQHADSGSGGHGDAGGAGDDHRAAGGDSVGLLDGGRGGLTASDALEGPEAPEEEDQVVSQATAALDAVGQTPEPEPERQWFRLTPDIVRRDAESFAPAERLRDNMAAIRLLVGLRQESRSPTEEEKEVLARYVGWGGIALFNPDHRMTKTYVDAKRELTTLVTETYGEAALVNLKESVLNAHYTNYDIVQFMWRALEKMGLKPGDRGLDPSAGPGTFGGLRPFDVDLTNIEIDPITADIARHLYPDDKVICSPFEDYGVPNDTFEFAISNVPFGDYGVFDKRYFNDKSLPALYVHDFFFIKALDKVKPGGIVAFVTSKGTMDKLDPAVRKAIHERGGDLIAGFRLPSGAFETRANTTVTTDILFFQKRAPGADRSPHSVDPVTWTRSERKELSDKSTAGSNAYFEQKFTHVLGEVQEGTAQFGRELMVAAELNQGETMDSYLSRRLDGVLDRIPANIMDSIERTIPFNEEDAIAVEDDPAQALGFAVPAGSYVLDPKGEVGVLINGRVTAPHKPLSARKAKVIKGLLPIRDAALAVLRSQVEGTPEADYLEAREHLNAAYDAFVAKHGPVTPAASRMTEDPSVATLFGIEQYNAETKTGAKADIFFQRTIRPPEPVSKAETPEEAVVYSMAYHGKVVPKTMVNLLGRPWLEISESLKGKIFKDPEYGGWLTRAQYLSGNVREKLRQAEAAAEHDDHYAGHVEALKEVLPEPLSYQDIGITLGAHWVPEKIHAEFMYEYLEIAQHARVSLPLIYDKALTTWKIDSDTSLASRVNGTIDATKGTQRCNAAACFMHAINASEPTVHDRDGNGRTFVNHQETSLARHAVRRVRDEFLRWCSATPERQESLAQAYNDVMRSIVDREYDGSYLRFDGLAAGQTLRKSQVDMIARGIEEGNSVIAHAVGAGKTAIIAGVALMARKMGLHEKPMAIVPKNLLFQVPAEVKRWFPSAKVLIITKDDLARENRKRFLYKVAANQWDLVVITRDAFARISLSPDVVKDFMRREIAVIDRQIMALGGEPDDEDKRSTKRAVRALVSKKKKIKADIVTQDASRDKNSVHFDHLGVDMLIADEAHAYKNLGVDTKMRNIAGVNTTASRRAADMNMKCSYVREKNGGRGIHLSTATPVTNTMAEQYIIMKLANPDVLESVGIETFDQWAACFGTCVQSLEQDPSGQTWRYVTRFAEFKNVPEMLSLYRSLVDIKTREQLKLPAPPMERIVVTTQLDESQRIMKKALAVRASNLSGRNELGADNILVVSGDFRLAMLDMRIFNDSFPRNPNGRVAKAVEYALKEYHGSHEIKGAQVFFSDFSAAKGHSQQPTKPGTFSIPEAIRDELVAAGVPQSEIAFIQDAKTDQQRQALHQAVRDGTVRFIFGGTESLGTGTNIQTRLVASHDLDAPHRPTDIEQRDGRSARQGNINEVVRKYTYTTEGYTREYESLAIKAKFIAQANADPKTLGRVIKEESGDSWADIMAMTTDNPIVKEKAILDKRIKDLQQERDVQINALSSLRWNLRSAQRNLGHAMEKVGDYSEFMEQLGDAAQDTAVIIDGARYEKASEAATAMLARLEEHNFFSTYQKAGRVEVGTYRGVAFSIKADHFHDSLGSLKLGCPDSPTILLSKSAEGAIASLRNNVKKMLDTYANQADEIQRRRAMVETMREALEEQEAKGFPGEKELAELESRAILVNEELLAVARTYSVGAIKDDPNMIAFTKIFNRRGKPLLAPHLLGLEPEPEDKIIVDDRDIDWSNDADEESGASVDDEEGVEMAMGAG